jgi:hypothetical protein
LWISGMDTALQSRASLLTPIDHQRSEIPMKNTKASSRLLALKKETIRTLGNRELAASSAGRECSVTGSGNIMCTPLPNGDPVAKTSS